jgi:arylsulfatase A-like enzyme
MPERSFLVIVTDQHRFDAVGVHGGSICQTPALDRLAASGTRFDNAYSICALSSPARASMYTGLYPHRHGLMVNEDEFLDGVRLVSEDFRDAGYACGFVGKWHCGEAKLPSNFGFEGMDVPGYGNCRRTSEYRAYLDDNHLEPGEIIPLGTGWRKNILLNGKVTGPVEATVPYFLAEYTIDMLSSYKQGGSPFLLFCNFWGPHAPYLPVEPYASMYDPKEIPPWGNFYDDLTGKPNAHRRYRDAFLGEGSKLRGWEEWSTWVAKYFGFVSMIDAQIGRILAALEDLGLGEDTVVLFTADHGDHIGAHGGIHDKNAMMYQETYHIPLIARLPGSQGGRVVDQPITNMDITPTLCDLAGIYPGRDLDGRSLVPLLAGEESTDWEEDVMCVYNGHHFAYQSRMVTDGRTKYVFNAPEIDEFYDLERDPWEMHNLIDDEDYQDEIAHKRSRLMQWMESVEDPLAGWIGDLYAPREHTTPEEYTPYRD